jgi:hypothetical protein
MLLVLVMCLASVQTFLVSSVVILLGFLLYPTLVHAKDRKWAKFDTDEPGLPSSTSLEVNSVLLQPHQEVADEASVSLLSDLSPTKLGQERGEVLVEGVVKEE